MNLWITTHFEPLSWVAKPLDESSSNPFDTLCKVHLSPLKHTLQANETPNHV